MLVGARLCAPTYLIKVKLTFTTPSKACGSDWWARGTRLRVGGTHLWVAQSGRIIAPMQ